MKKAALIFLMFCSAQAMSQSKPALRLNVYTGYVFDDNVDSYYSNTSYYNGTVNGNFQWGLGLEYMLRPNQGIELSYLREDTKAPTTYYDNSGVIGSVKTKDFDLGINYIMLGSTRYFPVKPAIEPYFGVQLGVGIINVSNPTNGNENTNTKFAWALRGGTNLWVSQQVGIKIQAGLTSVAQAVGGGLYFGTGGIGTGVATYSTILQFSLGGGLVFKFGGQK